MLLLDLYMLESFYGAAGAAAFWSDSARRYGSDLLEKALSKGDITLRRIHVGPDLGRRILYLTDQGREKAQQMG